MWMTLLATDELQEQSFVFFNLETFGLFSKSIHVNIDIAHGCLENTSQAPSRQNTCLVHPSHASTAIVC